ncbi:MAG: hypothetical protein WBG69_09340 [Arcobacteraceae bacterium]
MNIELRFLQKAIEDKNYITFSYEAKKIQKIKPYKLTQKNDTYFLETPSKIFDFSKITKLHILKERF